ncbi:MAG: lipocalin-like domain-containing protein [Deferrisomatales bacterium]|nr:lipocalin-like domain-containing protein [Deferrisomatales bacterium]
MLLALLLLCGAVPGQVRADGWLQADAPREWSFPRDHGAHPAYRTEWWYFTGNLADDRGGVYGYQLTIFRIGVRTGPDPAEGGNPWVVRDLYLGHLAVSDGAGGAFHYADRLSRVGPGLAGASTKELEVWVLDWRAQGEGGAIHLTGGTEVFALDLVLRPDKPVVLHGSQGLSRKGPRPGQASYYASLTSLATSGTLRLAPGAMPVEVTGVSWFDQEFGSNQLAEDQAGWDWFSLHLGDGRELMLYLLRRTDGTVEPASSGTLVEADGRAVHLALSGFRVEVLDTWVSPRSGARYPSRWRVTVPEHGVSLELAPLLADQELVTTGATGVVYWEGAATGGGVSGPCRGYVELTGYAGALGGLF